MILTYLIFAHLLGDFVFQPTKLVEWKMKSSKGNLVHAIIHFLTMVLVLSPFIFNGYWGLLALALGISFVHFWIDEAKINYNLKHDKKVLPFIVDQLMHFITIAVAYFLIMDIKFILPEGGFYAVYGDVRLIIFLSFVVFVTTVIEVFRFQNETEKKKNTKIEINMDKMMSRVVILSVIYLAFLLLSLYLA